jgi:glutathionylspermidine synthase
MAQSAVKPLFDMCVELVAEYIDDVESLWGLPDAIKASLLRSFNARSPCCMCFNVL